MFCATYVVVVPPAHKRSSVQTLFQIDTVISMYTTAYSHAVGLLHYLSVAVQSFIYRVLLWQQIKHYFYITRHTNYKVSNTHTTV